MPSGARRPKFGGRGGFDGKGGFSRGALRTDPFPGNSERGWAIRNAHLSQLARWALMREDLDQRGGGTPLGTYRRGNWPVGSMGLDRGGP